MTTVQLSTIVLNDAVDPSDFLVLDRMTTYQRKVVKEGRVQRVAGGAFRAITQQGTQQTWSVTISKAPAAATTWIADHIGRVVCIRDDAGQKLFGVYLAADIEEVPYPRTGSVSLELVEVTWTEAV